MDAGTKLIAVMINNQAKMIEILEKINNSLEKIEEEQCKKKSE